MVSLASPIAVVAHDAGAANLIIGWINELSDFTIKLSLKGPARAIFKQHFPDLENTTLAEALDEAVTLLSGTSGGSDLEHQARKMARELNIPSIGVIDHWVNYRMRFERNGEQILPDEIWVSDELAYSRALSRFPGQAVCQKPNRYLEYLVKQIKLSPQYEERADKNSRVLYVLEPIRIQWNDTDISGEFQALDYFIENIATVGLDRDTEIVLRAHPSDPVDKYSSWCDSKSGYNISVDREHSLSDLIAWADWVVGCETFAMVIALHAGRHTLSTLPPWAPPCSLPQDGIIKLRELI